MQLQLKFVAEIYTLYIEWMLRARLAPVLVYNSQPVQGQVGAEKGQHEALALSQIWVDLGLSQLRLLATSASRVMLFVCGSGHARGRQQQLGAAATQVAAC